MKGQMSHIQQKIYKVEKYDDPVMTYCAAVRIELHNPNFNLDLLNWKMAHQLLWHWDTFTPILVVLHLRAVTS